MAYIDPTTSIGKLRYRCGDINDIQLMNDTVYQSCLDDNQGYLPRAALLASQYILAMLTSQVHEKMGILETFGKDYYDNYVQFLKLTMLNPHLMTTAPVPYSSGGGAEHPLLVFQDDWNNCWSSGTQSQQMHLYAIGGFLNTQTFGM